MRSAYPTEHQEQCALIEYMHLMEVQDERWGMLFAVPNVGAAGIGGKVRQHILKREGQVPGIPDLILAWPSGRYHGLFIEMKRKGGRLTSYQELWLERLNKVGYKAVCCYGADEAIKTIHDYLEDK